MWKYNESPRRVRGPPSCAYANLAGYARTSRQIVPGRRHLQFCAQGSGVEIEVKAQLPEGPVRPAVLLPIIQNLSNSICEMKSANSWITAGGPTALELPRRLRSLLPPGRSHHAGGGAGCFPLVDRSAARGAQKQPSSSPLSRRPQRDWKRAELRRASAKHRASLDRETAHALGLKYFALGIPCPFLEEERCTIHEIRPLRCREYLVVSPAEHCAHPATKRGHRRQAPGAALSQVLGKWSSRRRYPGLRADSSASIAG